MLNRRDFVSSTIADLLELRLISKVSNPPNVINPLSFSVNSEGNPRLILDLRHVDKHIPKAKLRMEDWEVFLQKSGYHHIDICQAHQQVLGFHWPLGGLTHRFFCFTVLPFGLWCAPYLFTKFFVR